MCEREGDDADVTMWAQGSVSAVLREDYTDGRQPTPAAAALRHLPRQDPSATAGTAACHQQELAGFEWQCEVVGCARLRVQLLGGSSLCARLRIAILRHQRRVFPFRSVFRVIKQRRQRPEQLFDEVMWRS